MIGVLRLNWRQGLEYWPSGPEKAKARCAANDHEARQAEPNGMYYEALVAAVRETHGQTRNSWKLVGASGA
jgi:hypothetical protein